jgi:hypothetical protein
MDCTELIPGLYSGNVAANSLCCGTTSVLEQTWMLFHCGMFIVLGNNDKRNCIGTSDWNYCICMGATILHKCGETEHCMARKFSHGLCIEKKISAGFLCIVNCEHICKKFAPKINVNMIVVFFGEFYTV